MTLQSELIKKVKAKNRLSNILLCLKALFDILPQILIVHIFALAALQTLSVRKLCFFSCAVFLCFVLKALCAYGAVWKAHEAAYNSLTELRMRIIAHLKKLPLGFFHERKTGDLTNIVQHDVEQAETYLAHGLPELMSATLMPALIFFIMLGLERRLALLMIAGGPCMWLVKTLSAPLWKKNFKIFSDSTKTMQENLMEYVSNISVIKAFGREETKTEKTLRSAKDYVFWVKKAMAGISVPMGLIDLFMESGVVLVIGFGLRLLSSGELSAERFILAVILGSAFTSSIAKTATLQHYGIVFNQAMEGIGSVLNVPVVERDESCRIDTGISGGDIEIVDVNFTYGGRRNALEHINLVFKRGSKNALIGSSGSGKTTIANLLMGFWRPDDGTIRIGGVDTKSLSERRLGALFSAVQQDVFLFNMSMEENIRIGKPDATKEEILSAAKKARIHDCIAALPHGYDTAAGEAGVKFSGGEKQRIAVARMFLKDAPIVILDEATAALDAENEAYIRDALADLSRSKTVIAIAHHLNAIRDADQIVVMDGGRIIDRGTHSELLKRCELYRTMVCAQEKVDRWNIKEETR